MFTKDILSFISRFWYIGFLAILVLLIYRFSKIEYPYSFEEITNKETVTNLNRIAVYDAKVLTLEVQYKYWMRADLRLLSLDGISDGKVDFNNITGFIKREKPRYYIPAFAGGKLHPDRDYFKKCILYKLHGDTIVDGIKFIDRGEFYELIYN